MIYGLTGQQASLLRFIRSCEEAEAVSPSYEEMAHAIGAKSKTTIVELVSQLEARGAIIRLPYKRRSIVTVPLPAVSKDLPQTADICALIKDAQKFGGTDDPHAVNRILADWLWHAVRGSSPEFAKMTEQQDHRRQRNGKIAALSRSGLPAQTLAARFDLDVTRIHQILREHGMGRNGPKGAATPRKPTAQWSPEDCVRLAALWQLGSTGSEAAADLGRSRNAVLGKVRRLGLPPRQSPIKYRSGEQEKQEQVQSIPAHSVIRG